MTKDDFIFFSIAGAAAWLVLENQYQRLSAEEQAALAYSADFTYGTGGFGQRILSAYARFRLWAADKAAGAGITTEKDRPAVPGRHLGPPKNVLGISGVIRTIENQDPRKPGNYELAEADRVIVPAFAETVLADSAIENQSNIVREGIVSARMLGANSTPYTIEGPSIVLAPGEFRNISLRIPRDYSYRGRMDFALQFEKHTLDRVAFNFEATL